MTTANLDDFYTYIDIRDPELVAMINKFVIDAEANDLFVIQGYEQFRADFTPEILERLKQLMPFPISDAGVFKNPIGWEYPVHTDDRRQFAMNMLIVDPDPGYKVNVYTRREDVVNEDGTVEPPEYDVVAPILYLRDQWVMLNTKQYHGVVNHGAAVRYIVSVGCEARDYDTVRKKWQRLGMMGLTTWRDQRHLALLSHWEKSVLQEVALALPKNATVVEVGSFMGGSCVAMARVRPDIEIHGFDLFELDTVNQWWGYRKLVFDRLVGKNNALRTQANVSKIVENWPNIQLHCARSPEGIEWTRPIDLYFEDGCHRDPELSANMEFWVPLVKPGGWVVLHDYRPHAGANWRWKFPDVESWVERLVDQGYELSSHIQGLAVLRKPA